MKKIFLFSVFALGFVSVFAQSGSAALPPYKRLPTLPPIQILLSDSSTFFTKAQIPHQPVLIIIFSPECEHCQHETEELIANKKLLKNVQIIMVTLEPLWKMKEFISKYKLNHYTNMVIGKDIYYILPSFYAIAKIPYMAMYNKKGNLITTHEGTMPVKKVIEVFKNAR